MFDPLSAITLASAIVQFVDFGSKVIAKGREIYESTDGVLRENQELQRIAEDLRDLDNRIATVSTNPNSVSSTEEAALQRLAKSCQEVAADLISLLKGLEAPHPGKKWNSFFYGLKNVWTKSKIDDLERKLVKLQKQLDSHLLKILSDKQSSLLSALRALGESHQRRAAKTKSSLDDLKSDILAAASRLTQISKDTATTVETLKSLTTRLDEEEQSAAAYRILQSLDFEMRDDRRLHGIREAHSETFEWILQETGRGGEVRFTKWLRSQHGVYWIAGKAGSGKSTLMRFLHEHPRTQELLKDWAGHEKLVIGCHFFWSSGYPMQRSQQGILQSLLFQILEQCPELIPAACLLRWADKNTLGPPSWTRRQLLNTIITIASQEALSKRFCFFLDGLDEYDSDDGTFDDLIGIIKRLTSSPSIKICASSRPWDQFDWAFGQSARQSLQLHEFTKEDTRLYVADLLEKDQQYCSRAQGVFLWVFFVVSSLKKGFKNRDDMRILQARLDMLPTDLEKSFAHILSKIDLVYQEQTSKIFQIAATAIRPLEVITYSFFEAEKDDPDFALKAEMNPTSPSEEQVRQAKTQTYLNVRCKDLLEVRGGKVTFLHRTVKDFLETKDIRKMLERWTQTGFDPKLYLCRAFLAQLKTPPDRIFPTFDERYRNTLSNRPSPDERYRDTLLNGKLGDCMYYVGEVEKHLGLCQPTLLEELDRTMGLLYPTVNPEVHWTNRSKKKWIVIKRETEKPVELYHRTFLALTVSTGLRLYVESKLNEKPDLLQERPGRRLLDFALGLEFAETYASSYKFNLGINPIIIRMLLDRGADPNEKVFVVPKELGWPKRTTVWGSFVDDYDRMASCRYRLFRIMEMLIKSGANPDIIYQDDKVQRVEESESVRRAVTNGDLSREEFESLRDLLKKKRGSGVRKRMGLTLPTGATFWAVLAMMCCIAIFTHLYVW